MKILGPNYSDQQAKLEYFIPGLDMLGTASVSSKNNIGVDWHQNAGIEFHYVHSGTMNMQVGKQKYKAMPGELIITYPWEKHFWGMPFLDPCSYTWVILECGTRRKKGKWTFPDWVLLSQKESEKLQKFLSNQKRQDFRLSENGQNCFERLKEALIENEKTSHLTMIKSLINEILSHLILEIDTLASDEKFLKGRRETVAKFLNRFGNEQELLAHTWSLDEMASQCRVSPSSLLRYCQEIFNQTPIQYLNQCRLEFAKEQLLNQPETSITQMSFECGFQSSQYFATMFRKSFGCSPKEWRIKNGVI